MHIIESRLDGQQRRIKNKLDNLILKINQSYNFWNKITSLFSKDRCKMSIYLYGKVGRGKTMLMKYFYDSVEVSKNMMHFQQFMRRIHEEIHKFKTQNISLNIIIQQLAIKLSREFKVLCLDEFEINDIADAMIIMQLFKELYKRKIIIFLTTNIEPDNLYKNGLQREGFLPFIRELYQRFSIFNLDHETDYRYLLTAKQHRIFAPKDKYSQKAISEIKNRLSKGTTRTATSTIIFGREIRFADSTKDIIFTNFSELFERNFSYADYGHITKIYKVFVVEDVRPIEENETDIVTRFINFIDNAYYNNILLFLSSECALNTIYTSGKKQQEFQRVLSRLNEMDSVEYYENYKSKL
ncbi:MAG: cell division protein ZapE [Rickettsiaceae bacterium]|nr:cell division protein ZapE [Rickettsiaceae bacterium]